MTSTPAPTTSARTAMADGWFGELTPEERMPGCEHPGIPSEVWAELTDQDEREAEIIAKAIYSRLGGIDA